MIWELGQDATGDNSLLKVINDAVILGNTKKNVLLKYRSSCSCTNIREMLRLHDFVGAY